MNMIAASLPIFHKYLMSVVDRAGLCYAIDMLLSVHVGFVVTYNLQKKIVLDGRQLLKYYLKKGSAVLDTLSVIPWIAQVGRPTNKHPNGHPCTG